MPKIYDSAVLKLFATARLRAIGVRFFEGDQFNICGVSRLCKIEELIKDRTLSNVYKTQFTRNLEEYIREKQTMIFLHLIVVVTKS